MTQAFFIVTISLIVFGVLLILVFNKLSDLEESLFRQANQMDRLSQELFIDYGCINEQFGACLSKIDSARRSISMEIACLATKNNEDIKRMKGGWQEGDVIESNGELYFVLELIYNPNDGGNPCGYRLIDQDRACSYSAKELVENATLVKHTSGLSDIFDE